MFIKASGRDIYTVAMGEHPHTFLAHSGWIGTWEDWQPQLEILSKNYRAISFDHRGTGYTMSTLEDITVEGMVDDIFAIMDNLGLEKVVLGGFSSGIRVALQAVLRHPERFDGLVLMCSILPFTPPAAEASIKAFANALLTDFDNTIRQQVLSFTPEAHPDMESLRYWMLRVLKKSSPEYASHMTQAFYGHNIPLESLKEIQIPTLLIQATKDDFGPMVAGEMLAANLPNSRMVLIEGGGHVCSLTRPAEVTMHIKGFLDSIYPD